MEKQKLMLSASNISPPTDNCVTEYYDSKDKPTIVLLLPAFTIVEGVTPAKVPDLIEQVIAMAPTNTTPLDSDSEKAAPTLALPGRETNGTANKHAAFPADPPNSNDISNIPSTVATNVTTLPPNPTSKFTTRPCPHRYLILLCSQKTRDARCGQSAPLLRRELERHLRPLGLYRDMQDERPGGVGIYFISHVGGHKYSANVMVYRRAEAREGKGKGEMGEAGQCVWLARVRPEDCEGIVKFTVLQGKVVKPERQLRGGFDREKGLVSW